MNIEKINKYINSGKGTDKITGYYEYIYTSDIKYYVITNGCGIIAFNSDVSNLLDKMSEKYSNSMKTICDSMIDRFYDTESIYHNCLSIYIKNYNELKDYEIILNNKKYIFDIKEVNKIKSILGRDITYKVLTYYNGYEVQVILKMKNTSGVAYLLPTRVI